MVHPDRYSYRRLFRMSRNIIMAKVIHSVRKQYEKWKERNLKG